MRISNRRAHDRRVSDRRDLDGAWNDEPKRAGRLTDWLGLTGVAWSVLAWLVGSAWLVACAWEAVDALAHDLARGFYWLVNRFSG